MCQALPVYHGMLTIEIENRHFDNTFMPSDVGGEEACRLLREEGITIFGELSELKPDDLKELGLEVAHIKRIEEPLRSRRLIGDP